MATRNVISNAQETTIDWLHCCRLCAKSDEDNVNVLVADEDEEKSLRTSVEQQNADKLNFTKAIAKFFGLVLSNDTGLSNMICAQCLQLLKSMICFYERVQKVQQLLQQLNQLQSGTRQCQNIAVAHQLKQKFGLLQYERDDRSVECQQELPEVHYLETKTNIGEIEKTPFETDSICDPLEPQIKIEIKAETLNVINSTTRSISSDDDDDHIDNTMNIAATTNETPVKMAKNTQAKDIIKSKLQCMKCMRRFSSSFNLKRHFRTHLPSPLKKTFGCPFCERKFGTSAYVQSHIKMVHQNERPFTCDIICEKCGVAVLTNAALKSHLLTHTDYAPFECEICKKGFKSQYRLKMHMEMHDSHKHVCVECGLELNTRATLNRHLLVHSDKMQHKCNFCGRAFKRAKALKTHLILHTGLKPYSCNFCERTFASGSNCRSHKKKAHPKELAALEAAGGAKSYTPNIPKLATLKAVTENGDNLLPVLSKPSGCFAFSRRPKPVIVKNEKDLNLKNVNQKRLT